MNFPGTSNNTNSMFPPIVDSKGKRVFNYWVFKFSEKIPVDDVVCHYLDGEMLKNALVFIDYVRASKMKIKQSSANVWSVKCRGKHVLNIMVNQDSWGVRLVYDHVKQGNIFTPGKAEEIRALVSSLQSNKQKQRLWPLPIASALMR